MFLHSDDASAKSILSNLFFLTVQSMNRVASMPVFNVPTIVSILLKSLRIIINHFYFISQIIWFDYSDSLTSLVHHVNKINMQRTLYIHCSINFFIHRIHQFILKIKTSSIVRSWRKGYDFKVSGIQDTRKCAYLHR